MPDVSRKKEEAIVDYGATEGVPDVMKESNVFHWVLVRTLCSFVMIPGCFAAGVADAQTNYPCAPAEGANLQVWCPDEGMAYMRATLDAETYFAANPKDAYGTTNHLCPTIKTNYNGPQVWVASVPTINKACTEQGGGYTNPVFRGAYPIDKTCAARNEQNDGSTFPGILRCNTGCEIAATNDGLIKPTGNVCAVSPARIEPAKNNCCEIGGSVTAE